MDMRFGTLHVRNLYIGQFQWKQEQANLQSKSGSTTGRMG